MTDQSRKDFEVYAKAEGYPLRIDDCGDYIDEGTRRSWHDWKASRVFRPIPLPTYSKEASAEFEQYCAAQCNSVIAQCRAAIEAAGYETE